MLFINNSFIFFYFLEFIIVKTYSECDKLLSQLPTNNADGIATPTSTSNPIPTTVTYLSNAVIVSLDCFDCCDI